MSYTRQVTVWCDDCGNWDLADKPLRELRAELKRKGWVHRGRSDFCPSCAKKEKEQ